MKRDYNRSKGIIRRTGAGVLMMAFMLGSLSGCGVKTKATSAGEKNEKFDFSLYGNEKEEQSKEDETATNSPTDSESTFSESSDEIVDKTAEIEKIINNYFYFEKDDDKREESYFDGIMRGLDDPYSVYYTKEEYEQMMEDDKGVFEGIGATLTKNREKGTVYVVKPLKGSPAEKAGLLPGDVIVQVDDLELTTDMELDYVVDHIRGKEGSEVKMKIYREGEEDFLDFTMTRAKIENTSVEYEMLENNVGYIQVDEFIENTDELFKNAVDDLQSQGAKSLVIDMRGNPGGLVTTVAKMADYMIDDDALAEGAEEKGILISTKNKDDVVMDKIVCSDGHSVDLPMVVLVDGNSASSSEIFTGCMKDYGIATVVGTTTYGKGIVQSIMKLKDGSAIKITIAKYFLPGGEDIHKKGVEPDVEVELDDELKKKATYEHDEDNQLQEALKVLEK